MRNTFVLLTKKYHRSQSHEGECRYADITVLQCFHAPIRNIRPTGNDVTFVY
jgi:hypothetical protein